jgi:hypothetical protein
MRKKRSKVPTWARAVLITTFVFYLWFLISTLMLPISEFISLPNAAYLTFYKIIEFPPAILGFMICISLFSTIVVIMEFKEQKSITKIFLTESVSFMLYFIIPIIATVFLLALLALRISGQVPSETRISYFLEDLFLFTSALFLMTAVLNIATHKIIAINTKSKQ